MLSVLTHTFINFSWRIACNQYIYKLKIYYIVLTVLNWQLLEIAQVPDEHVSYHFVFFEC